ncbi:MAG TPA: hypothetical protein DCZ94_21930 [Lentisphaeria bacterium]|nr:MAG: hypothetical protein A2X48_19230 [Lentisphaerae bacterium GWF2_49_21]HBC89606.1 hypothetical protein [Lentisphaeria bacterium]
MVKVLILTSLISCAFSVNSEDKPSANQPFVEAVKLLSSEKNRSKGITEIAKFAREKKDSDTKFDAKALLSETYRDEKKIDKALEAVSDCSDFDRISKNSTFPFKSSYLKAFLEAAHCKAADRDKPSVRESFKMLDYAENNTEGIDKARSQYKYGAVLFDLNEFSKADMYLRKALETAEAYLKEKKGKVSEGDAKLTDGNRDYKQLKPKIDELLFLVSIELLEAEYGEEYALYVKARTLYDEKSYEASMTACRDLLVKYPRTLCEQAIHLTYSDCFSEIGKTDEAKKVLEDFIKRQSKSVYFGDALMRLGKISLEKDLDADAARKYYSQALDFFQLAREQKDSIDLYTVSDKVSIISSPVGPLIGLDEWFRTTYRKQGAKEIIDIKNAPWLRDEKERECLTWSGFLHLVAGRTDKARECFLQIKTISKDLAMLDAKHIPNALWRLESACNVGYMVFSVEEKKYLKGKNKLLCSYAELNYLIEKFDVAKKYFRQIADEPRNDDCERAIALIGTAACGDRSKEAEKMLSDAMKFGGKTPIAGTAMIYLASYCHADADRAKEAATLFESYLKLFPDGRFRDKALFRLGYANMRSGNENEAEKYLAKLKESFPGSGYTQSLEDFIKNKGKIQ